ncbi:exonuclease subunit SbcD [Pragia fontium]|uniref:Nuclease SbcCD subunit D n=2 Tax=Pragia fontium TaxID=82985 RepID=A0AAJ4WBA4_9GAMM|nr:exonuclease subunit SbcD [Pragia fontium]AKJ42195.1 exonuclease SbcD [Pragia fontium]SFC97893.1 Exodeoxyribonuclease I subunit D [Pragia fontium DSM 5563 = ATCC 49100]SUB82457.1 Nuclease sbcCD subunit D [Pragia fontium]VEJ55359.1 Nuclease sbcCD subunit D [Pragia fontium]GKX61746.1 nuclease SbcCD subunit D [Pragia fontium]
MRIIHTSDWHLGQYFFTKSRAPEHAAFLRWLTEQVKQHQVDAIIVAGDIFDTTSPPSYARELYNQFIVELQQTHCQLVVLGGNHDSVAMLNESRQLLTYLNTQVIAGVTPQPEQQVIELHDAQGKPAALVCAIPFVRPRDIVISQAGQSAQEKQQSLLEAIAEHYRQIYQLAQDKQHQYPTPLPIIVTGHLTTVGASTTDSVREIYIGTLDAFPAQLFPPADYIALGHIHRPQIVAKSDYIRYSGSPIPLSFDEANQEKSVVLVDFNQGLQPQITLLPIPEFQPMRLIKGDIDEIKSALNAFHDYQGEKTVWLDIEVNSRLYLNDLQRQIQQLAETLPVDVVLLRRSKALTQQAIQRQEKETLSELTVNDVFERRLALDKDENDSDQQRECRIQQLFRTVVNEMAEENQSTAKDDTL